MSLPTQKLELPSCKRTGMCCTRIMIPCSPRELRESYECFQHNRLGYFQSLEMHRSLHKSQVVVYQDIELIFPMLVGRCHGRIDFNILYNSHKKFRDSQRDPEFEKNRKDNGLLESPKKPNMVYVYGPCRFLEHNSISSDGTRKLASCSIQDHKPKMCSTYPESTPMGSLDWGIFKGCGFNWSPEIGATFTDIYSNLQPLQAEDL